MGRDVIPICTDQHTGYGSHISRAVPPRARLIQLLERAFETRVRVAWLDLIKLSKKDLRPQKGRKVGKIVVNVLLMHAPYAR